jgi:hypothetical protein
VRIARGSVKTVVYQAIQHPSKVLEVRLKRRDGKPFRYKSGQYAFLNSPYLAGPEWHPFTITSAPNGDPYLSFHIKVRNHLSFFACVCVFFFFFFFSLGCGGLDARAAAAAEPRGQAGAGVRGHDLRSQRQAHPPRRRRLWRRI